MTFNMRFYKAALQRALDREYMAFRDHTQGKSDSKAWIKALKFTNALRHRRARELGK